MSADDNGRIFLDRSAIFGADDIPTEEVHVPEWGGYVKVRGLTAAQRDAYEQSLMEGKGKDKDVNMRGARAKLAVLTIVGDDGRRVFSNRDAEPLGEKSASALDAIFAVAARLSGITDEDMEELGKASLALITDDDFSTDSP